MKIVATVPIVPPFEVKSYVGMVKIHFKDNKKLEALIKKHCNVAPAVKVNNNVVKLSTGLCCSRKKYTIEIESKAYDVELVRRHSGYSYKAYLVIKTADHNIVDFFDRSFDPSEFAVEYARYIFDFYTKNTAKFLKSVKGSEYIMFASQNNKKCQVFWETVQIGKNKEVARLNLFINLIHNQWQMYRSTITSQVKFDISVLNNMLKFYWFDFKKFRQDLHIECTHLTNSQMASIQKQINKCQNMNEVKWLHSKYVRTSCLRVHPFYFLFTNVASDKSFELNPPKSEVKYIEFDTGLIFPESHFFTA